MVNSPAMPAEPGTRRLGFVGDVMLGRNVDTRRQSDPPETIWGEVLPWLRDLDGLFGNLECCLSARGEQWTRTRRAFHFRAGPDWAVPALQAAGFDWLSLANNHILDYEEVALRDTLDAMDGGDIGHTGAGRSERKAWEPSVVSVGDLDVGLVACTDNTPEYAAEGDDPGTAWTGMDVDDAEDLELVREALDDLAAREPDLLVASLHWGPNMVAEPAREYVEFGHWLVDRGVDLIHGHSAHNVQGIERYGDGLILHDCGDFVDDYAVDRRLRNDRGFLFVVPVSPGGDVRGVHLRPIQIQDCTVQPAEREVAAWSRDHVRKRSVPFGTAEAFEQVEDGLWLPM
ncbi:MAG: CapA family protein [Haloarculaceae archaeon]